MTVVSDEDGVRQWLVDYLVTNVGCSPEEVDVDASMHDLGVGSRDAVVLSGELSDLLGRSISPVEFWQYPTINALARFLSGSEFEGGSEGIVLQAHRSMDDPIAVVGLGCRFPGGVDGPELLWRLLCERRSVVGEVPAQRWAAFEDGSPEVAAALAGTTRWGSFLTDVDAFDAEFFEISPREAVKMDPQQRLLLEVSHEALEHAGIPGDSLRRTQTGVFVGACQGEYGYLASSDLSAVDAWSGTGGALSIIANRVSYVLDLRGPSVAVDTACSSSLVAVHMACQSLRTGDSDLALAAGVNLLLSPAVTRSFDQAQAMSPTGQCHAFDAAADGFVRGEGAGVVVLKRLADAQRDGDRVLAVVRGSAVNQDGRSNGLMAPNPSAQIAVLRAAYANGGVDPRGVDYVEAHGTGTLLGDPIEARALGTVLGRARPVSAPLLIGAVKSNLGHTEAAAGIAGFIKAVLAVDRGHIPANVNFENPNPHIPFDSLRLKVVAESTDWPSAGRPRRAGVSSFGFGGTNAHVVIEQAPDRGVVPAEATRSPVSTLVVSGKTPARVASMATVLADWMDGDGADVALPDVAHTLNHHRTRYPKFATVCARDRKQAVAGLRALAHGYTAPGVVGAHQGPCGPGTVFVYSGQGSQWPGMGRRLLAEEPAFAAAVTELEPVFVEQVGFSLQQVLAAGQPVVGIDRIQPVLVGMQLALTALWRSYGVHPDAVIGHSMGEVTAAVVAGALSPADGLRVIATRSRLMSRLSGQGAMALLELDAHSTEELIADHPGVTLAVYASPRQTVIAGPPEQIDAIIATVDAQDRLARRIDVDVASHHPTIDPILPDLRDALADLTPQTPTTTLIPTTGTTNNTPTFDADYWVTNLRNPVRFSQAITTAATKHHTFIEISPHPLLTHAITDTLPNTHHHSLPTLQRNTDDTTTFHTNLNAAHTVHPPATGHAPEPHPVLPTSPWHHTRHWASLKRRVQSGGSAPRPGTLLGDHTQLATTPPVHLWQARLVPEAKPYPGGHRIQGVEVVPVSVLLQTISVAAAQSGAIALSDIKFENPIVVNHPQVIQVVADRDFVTVSSTPSSRFSENRWVRHLSARLSDRPADDRAEAAEDTVNHELSGYDTSSVAELQRAWGIEDQPFPWSINSCHTCGPASGGIHADVAATEVPVAALLDAAVHLARLVDGANPGLMVPAAIEHFEIAPDFADGRGSVEAHKRGDGDEELVVDIVVKASDGSTGIDIRELRYTSVDARSPRILAQDVDPRTLAHVIEWRRWPGRVAPQPACAGSTVAVVGRGSAARTLALRLADDGYTTADLAEARYVVYVADSAESGETDIDCAVRLSADVADLVRELTERPDRHPATLWITTRGVREAASPAALRQSSLWGVAGVIDAEQPQLWGGLVDIAADVDIADAASALATILPTSPRTILALREGEFLASAMATLSGQPVREPLRCRPDSAYLITGGMGALGLLMAGWLVDRGARRLVLAGRTGLPPRRNWDDHFDDAELCHKIAAIRALEMRGVSIDAVALDVGSHQAVMDMLARRDGAGAPPIRGVIHAAGVAESLLLTNTSGSGFRRIMWPKIAGAQALHQAFPAGSLDFFFLTASAGTVFGVPGQGAYAAANAYLDGLARSRHGQGCHTLSLDWVAWEGLGFALDADVVAKELDRHGSRPIKPSEAFAAWERVQCYEVAQAVMGPLAGSDELVDEGPDTRHTAMRAWSQMPTDDILRELETGLRTILSDELQMPEVQIESDRPFAELGLNSVMAMSIRREAEKLVGLELSATMLWNHPTIASLAEYLAERLVPAIEPDVTVDATPDASVLDALFDDVESASAGSESGRR